MFAVPLEQIALSNRERAFCKRADLINSAQLLFAQPDDSPAVRTLFECTQFDLIREEAARVQAPESTSILTALVSANCNLEEECFASGDDEREDRAITSLSSKALGKRKSLTSGVTRRKATNLSDPFTLTSGDREIDALLGGGWRRGCLTEIVGESSSGKSQLGMQTVLYTTLGLTTFRGEEEEEDCPTCSVRRTLHHDDKDDDDLFRALQGCGVQIASSRGSVAILNSGGRGKGDMIVRRLLQLCNTHIEQRWNAKQGLDVCECRKSRRKTEAHKAAGLFQKEDESSANSLQEVQLMAKGVLLSNLHLLSPKDYDSLEHAVTYTLPALAERLASQGQPRLSLVIVDDLPDMLIEEEGENVNHSSFTLRRSRMVGEIADRLKRLAVFSPLPDSSTSPLTAMALIVMNQVVDSFKANEDLLWPMLQQQADVLDEYASQTGPPPLTSAYQDAYFNGALASVDIATFVSSKQRLAEQMHGLADQDSFIPDAISSSTKIAALGHSWVNCINVRIMLSKTKKVVAMPSSSGARSTRTVVRRAVSVLNPFAEAGQGWRPHVEYILCAQGVRALSDVLLMQQRGDVASAASIPDEDQLWSSLDVDLDTADLDGVLAGQEKRGLEGGDSDSDSDGEWWKSIADSDIAECGSRF